MLNEFNYPSTCIDGYFAEYSKFFDRHRRYPTNDEQYQLLKPWVSSQPEMGAVWCGHVRADELDLYTFMLRADFSDYGVDEIANWMVAATASLAYKDVSWSMPKEFTAENFAVAQDVQRPSTAILYEQDGKLPCIGEYTGPLVLSTYSGRRNCASLLNAMIDQYNQNFE